MKKYLGILFVFLCGCSGMEDSEYNALRHKNQKGEYITRTQDRKEFSFIKPSTRTRGKYPWEENLVGTHSKITKEFFRCKGNTLSPPRSYTEGVGEPQRLFDCGGIEKHSLYLKDGKEFIYPILLDLLNYVQEKTGKRVIITSGYRCPDHNSYIDPTSANKASKHMIGAEVDFYVQGLESRPEAIVNLIIQYYQGKKDLEKFERYEKDSNVSTLPWYNKEIFIKVFKSHEGRDLDNRHNYPYISLQVRLDSKTQEKVVYNWKDAFHNYLRK